jgi:hypothetical protein
VCWCRYTKEELESYRATICDNLISSIMAVMKAMMKLRINLGDQSNRPHVMTVLNADRTQKAVLPETLARAIKALWVDPGVQVRPPPLTGPHSIFHLWQCVVPACLYVAMCALAWQ